MAKKKTTKKEVAVASNIYEKKPVVYFDNNLPKDIVNANVGDTVKLVIDAKVVSKSERDDAYSGGKRRSASLEINKVKKPAKKKKTTTTKKPKK